MSLRTEKVSSLLKDIVASFVKSKIALGVIFTVTRIDVASDLKTARVFFAVFPEEKEKGVLELLKKEVVALRNYAKPRLKMKFLPAFEFEIDMGEKHRQRLEQIMSE